MITENVAAIVTGGASGLGGATAALLAELGAKVSVFDVNAELGEAHAAEIGGKFFKVDVTSEAEVDAALDGAEFAHGIARILVNCAGIGPAIRTVGREFAPHPIDAFRKVIEINLIGSFLTASRFAARAAREEPVGEERGVIVNTASVAAFDGQIGQAAYAASKGGLVGLTLPLARDLAQHAIRVATVAPGIFLTPLLATLPDAARDSLGKQVPFPSRLGDPAEFARMVAAIIDNPMLNGETIRLDGAIRMGPR
ncbi:SDR family NAD(P)-dependent oxidoreductase [soil metagenome]